MTDTSRCGGFNCPFKDECIRYTGTTTSWQQSYIGPAYKEGACDNFLPNADWKPPTWYHKALMWKWLWPVVWVVFITLIALMSL